ncbi:MAG: hypothetical protein JWO82_1366 [Akkermansiaceae bacterium]|nr:hypothetical protein [Akkermansiaceae bacterium]
MEFDTARRELIEAVLEPLPEQEKARQTLEAVMASTVGNVAPEREGRIPAVTARMRKSALGFGRKRRGGVIAPVTALIAVVWMAWLSPAARRELEAIRLAASAESGMQFFSEDKPPPLFFRQSGDPAEEWNHLMNAIHAKQRARMSWENRSLVGTPLGDDAYLGKWKAAWLEEPDNPALYFRWAVLHANRNFNQVTGPDGDAWPADFVETGEKLDPGNGWFRYCHAAGLAKLAFDRSTGPAAKAGVADPDKMREALAELDRASSMPRWEDYRAALFRRETEAWPKAADLPDQLISTLAFGGRLSSLDQSASEELREALRISLETTAEDPDPAILDKAAVAFRDLRTRWAKLHTGYGGREKQRQMTEDAAAILASAYLEKGEKDQAASYSQLAEEMGELAGPAPFDYHLQSHLAQVATKLWKLMPSARDELEMRAGRMGEYAMWERLMFRAIAALLAVVGMGLLLLLRWGRQGGLAARLRDALTVRERVAILLVGCGLPAAVYFGGTRFVPVAQAESISVWASFLMLSQAAGMLMAMFLITVGLGRWLLVGRVAVLGFRKGNATVDLVFTAFCLAWIPLAACVQWIVAKLVLEPVWSGMVAGLIVLLPALWLGWRSVLFWWAGPEKRVHQTALLGLCVPVVGTGAIMALLAAWAIHAEERRWVREMRVGAVHSLENGLISPRQVERAEEIRQSMLRTLDR